MSPSTAMLALLDLALTGLTFPSEQDAPLKALAWGDADPDEAAVRKLAGATDDASVEQITLHELLGALGEEQSWHEELDRRDAARFRGIEAFMTTHLEQPRAYRVGRPDVQIYAVGKLPGGPWIGFETKAVET